MAENISGKQVLHPGSSQAASWRERTLTGNGVRPQSTPSSDTPLPTRPHLLVLLSPPTGKHSNTFIHTAILGMGTHLKPQQLEVYGRRVVSSRQGSAI